MGYRANSGSGVIPVAVASTAPVVIASGLVAGTVIGGYTLVLGDIVFIKDQTVQTQNGLYVVPAAGAAARSAKMQTGTDAYGALIAVRSGMSSGNTYTQTSTPAIVGTNALVFSIFAQGVMSEYGVAIAPSNVGITAGQNSAANSADFIIFALPSAGVWQVSFTVRAQGGFAATGAYAVESALFTSANVLVAGTEVLSSYMTAGSSTASSAASGTGFAQITTTGATTYKVRVWNNQGNTNATATSDLQGRSSVTWTKISGQAPADGQMVDTLYASRGTTNQTQATNWSSKDIIFNNVGSGNIPFNTTTGVATLTAGKTYNCRAGLAWTVGSTYLIQWALFDAVTNIQLSSTVEQIQATSTGFNISDPQLDYTFTPTTNQTVKIRTTAGNNMLSGESLRYDLNTFFSITQVGSSSYSGVTLIGTPTLGQVPVSQADGTALWSTPGAVTSTSVDCVSGLIGSLAPSAGSAMNVTFESGNMALTSNAVVLAAGRRYNLGASVVRVNGSSGSSEFTYCFRDITNGVYLGAEGSISQNTALGAGSYAAACITPVTPITVQLWCVKNVGVSSIGSNDNISGPTAAGYVTVTQVGATAYSGVSITGTPTAGQVLTAQAGGTTAIWNTPGVPTTVGVDYIYVKHSVGQTTTNNSPFVFDTVLGGSMTRPSTAGFLLLAGKTYRLEGSPGASNGTAFLNFQWRDTTNNVYIGNSATRVPVAASNANSVDVSAAICIITPTVNMVVQLWGQVTTGNLWGQGATDNNNSFSYALIQQLGSTAYSGVNITNAGTVGQPLLSAAGGATFGDFTGGVTSSAGVLTVQTNANLTGSVTSIGNAATVITNANLTGMVTSSGNATTVVTNANLTGMVTSAGNTTTVVTNANLTGGVTSLGNAATVITNANLTGMVTSTGNATTVVTNANLTGSITSTGNATAVAMITTSSDTPVGSSAGTSPNVVTGMSIVPTGAYNVCARANLQVLLRPAEMVAQAATDLTALYSAVSAITTPVRSNAATINNVTLLPGVYDFVGTAIVLGTNITLSGTATDYWIFKTTGAMSSTASASTITLTGGATAANVFWLIGNNAPSLGASTTFKGTILNTAAIALPASINFEGRMLTTAGAISVGASAALYIPAGACTVVPMGVLNTFLAYTIAGANSTTSTVVAYGDVGSKDTAVATWAANNLSGSSYGPGTLAVRAAFGFYTGGTLVPYSLRTVDFIRSTQSAVTLESVFAVIAGPSLDVKQQVMCGSSMVTNKMLTVTRLT